MSSLDADWSNKVPFDNLTDGWTSLFRQFVMFASPGAKDLKISDRGSDEIRK